MSYSTFRFKQFELHQELCAMKVGTDSVLLGAWAHIPQQGYLLDIGCGTGILSLMVAQRARYASIKAIEIDIAAARQSQENIAQSPWHERIEVICGDFTQIAHTFKSRFDSIISNPPYFEQSLLSPDSARTTARHTTSLSYDTIFQKTRDIITPNGNISLVIPADLYEHVNDIAMLYGWGASRLTMVRTTSRKAPKRALCEWRRNHYAPCHEEILTIYSASGQYSDEYKNLTKEFYLKF
ncbi:MAG: tRNA1(Val) (adenine(37)-N6)-methyltransferase [Bacteroidaceae bacterium]|nr:tRNA1(Val) (adenine(37)-N6)-methyltransferase [Bacteroidaceae bacterium]